MANDADKKHEHSATTVPEDNTQPVEPWEDGYRTNGLEDAFEWWYFDSIYEDGTTIVVTYTTKAKKPTKPPLTPNVTTIIKDASGEKRKVTIDYTAADFSSSTETCDVIMGPNHWKGDLDHYEMHNEGEGVSLDLAFDRGAPSWRPNGGVDFVDETRTTWSGWVVPVPYGTVEGTLTVDGESRSLKGTCYHDHNWSNVNLGTVLDHWYWGRGHIGDFTLVFAMLTDRKSSGIGGRKKTPLFYLAKGDEVITDDADPLTLVTRQFVKGPGDKTYPELLDWHWHTEEGDVHLALRDVKLLDAVDLSEVLPRWERPLAHLFVGKPFYFDFHGELELTVDLGSVHERAAGSIIFEKMMLK